MTRNKSRLARTCLKYIAPAIVLLTPPTSSAASGTCCTPDAPPGRCRPCYCQRFICTSIGKCPGASPKCAHLIPTGDHRLHRPGPSAGSYTLFVGTPTNKPTMCVNTMSHPVQNYLGSTCKGRLKPNAGVAAGGPERRIEARASYRANSSALARTMAYLTTSVNTYRPTHEPTSAVETNAHKLAKITLHLVITELNNVPGGLHLNPGEPITASQLTEEQRIVLTNHRGLIREALRQLKAAKAEEGAPVPG